MKRLVLFLALSGAANAALLAVFSLRPALAPAAWRDYFRGGSAPEPASSARLAAPAPAREKDAATTTARAGLWAALDTDDLPALVARLRAAGFTSNVVRAIVTAKVEARFASRLADLFRPAQEAPFWKANPGSSMMDNSFWDTQSQIYRERSRLLRDVLGDDFFAFAGSDPALARRRQFGDLPPAKVDLIQRIQDDYAEMSSQVRGAMGNVTLPEDREKLALLERERRADIAAVLTPQELEEYEMRSSSTASRLRAVVSAFNASEDEYRALFRLQQQFDNAVASTNGPINTPEMEKQRATAQKLLTEQIQATLGPERYADYRRASDREYQQLSQLAQRENLSVETTLQAYNLRETYAAQSTEIMNNASLDADQKRAALQTLGQNARTQMIGTLGQTAGTAFAQASRWIRHMEGGGAIALNSSGALTYRNLPPPPAPGAK